MQTKGVQKRMKCYQCKEIATHTGTGKKRSTKIGRVFRVQAECTCGRCGETYFTERLLR